MPKTTRAGIVPPGPAGTVARDGDATWRTIAHNLADGEASRGHDAPPRNPFTSVGDPLQGSRGAKVPGGPMCTLHDLLFGAHELGLDKVCDDVLEVAYERGLIPVGTDVATALRILWG